MTGQALRLCPVFFRAKLQFRTTEYDTPLSINSEKGHFLRFFKGIIKHFQLNIYIVAQVLIETQY
jgi:hypothetical protein